MESESEPFQISSLKLDPEDSEIQAPVKLSLGFTPATDIEDFLWRVSYMIDTVMKRQILQLLETEPQRFSSGEE